MSANAHLNNKYLLLIFISNELEPFAKDIDIKIPLLPNENYFDDFRQIVMSEFERLTFNSITIEFEPCELELLEQKAKEKGCSLTFYIVDTLTKHMEQQKEL